MQRALKLTPVQSPCYGCGDRQIGCHAECEKYRSFRCEADKYIKGKQHEKDSTQYSAGFQSRAADYEKCKRRGRLHD